GRRGGRRGAQVRGNRHRRRSNRFPGGDGRGFRRHPVSHGLAGTLSAPGARDFLGCRVRHGGCGIDGVCAGRACRLPGGGRHVPGRDGRGPCGSEVHGGRGRQDAEAGPGGADARRRSDATPAGQAPSAKRWRLLRSRKIRPLGRTVRRTVRRTVWRRNSTTNSRTTTVESTRRSFYGGGATIGGGGGVEPSNSSSVPTVSPVTPLPGGGGGGIISEAGGGDGTLSDFPGSGKVVKMFAIGAGSGFLAGVFGVGGGILTVPAISLATDLGHKEVLGTSLAAMVLPAFIGSITHFRQGNLVPRIAFPLALGTGAGAFLGGKYAARHLDEETLKLAFCCLMLFLGTRTVAGARAAAASKVAKRAP
ncbi:unnamed protein product, partial [Pylaiella littoralis]